MNQSQVKEFAAIGSQTAQALMAQMSREAAEAESRKEALASARKQEDATQRSERIKAAQDRIDAGLAAYEEHRKLAQDGLNSAFEASFHFPLDAHPRQQFDFLKKTHMPPVHPGANDELWPVFTSTEQFIQGVIAGNRRR